MGCQIGVNLKFVSNETAFKEFKKLLITRKVFLYVLLDLKSQDLKKKIVWTDIKALVTG